MRQKLLCCLPVRSLVPILAYDRGMLAVGSEETRYGYPNIYTRTATILAPRGDTAAGERLPTLALHSRSAPWATGPRRSRQAVKPRGVLDWSRDLDWSRGWLSQRSAVRWGNDSREPGHETLSHSVKRIRR